MYKIKKMPKIIIITKSAFFISLSCSMEKNALIFWGLKTREKVDIEISSGKIVNENRIAQNAEVVKSH